MKNDKIAIIGSGALGTALAKVLLDGGHKSVIIYGIDLNELSDLSKGKNTKYFSSSVKLPMFKTTSNLNEAIENAKYIILAVPSKIMDLVFSQVMKEVSNETIIINGSKGFYPKTKLSLHAGLMIASKKNNYIQGVVSLIGPSHAEEIVLGLPTVVAAVDENKVLAENVQILFTNKYFKVYVQTDVKGAEVGAAYKNVLAIAAGMSNGLGFGINAIAALLTRGLVEMQIFNKVMHGKPETIMGLTGVGDLIATATSDLSRNFTFGKNLAKNGQKAIKDNLSTVEGMVALKNIKEIADEKNLNLPIVNFLYGVIYEKKAINNFVTELWERKHKAE